MGMQTLTVMGAIAVLTTIGSTFAIDAFPQTAHAETHGMNRRDDRRDTRQGSRSTKHDCNAAGGSSRSDCRQTKRDVKQEGRQTR